MKQIVNVPLEDEHKETVEEIITQTIKGVFEKNDKPLTAKKLRELKASTYDHINNHVTDSVGLKHTWNMSIADSIPVLINAKSAINSNSRFEFLTNARWVSDSDSPLSVQEFKERVVELFLSDVETAAFYISFSIARSIQ